VITSNCDRLLHTTVLGSYAQYVRWSNGRLKKDKTGWGYPPPKPGDYEGASRDIERRRSELKHMAPREFPCVAVIQCVSCNMQESEPFYLYGADLQRLLDQVSDSGGRA